MKPCKILEKDQGGWDPKCSRGMLSVTFKSGSTSAEQKLWECIVPSRILSTKRIKKKKQEQGREIL